VGDGAASVGAAVVDVGEGIAVGERVSWRPQALNNQLPVSMPRLAAIRRRTSLRVNSFIVNTSNKPRSSIFNDPAGLHPNSIVAYLAIKSIVI
jgi:hypothetical protein